MFQSDLMVVNVELIICSSCARVLINESISLGVCTNFSATMLSILTEDGSIVNMSNLAYCTCIILWNISLAFWVILTLF